MEQTIKMRYQENQVKKIEERFLFLEKDIDMAILVSARNRVQTSLKRLERLLKEALEIKKNFLMGDFSFLPDEIASFIKEKKRELEYL